LKKERSIYENARAVFTMSSHVSRSLRDQYGIDESKIQCVRTGSNIDIPPPEALSDERYARKNILFVGIDWERKGGPQLIEAFKKVLQQHPDAQLTIIGCSPRVDAANCKILGRLPLQEISKHYRSATIFCLPTRNEPFGVASGSICTPLRRLSTDAGALPDIIKTGKRLMVPPDDIGALAERIVELISSPDKCRQYGHAGFEHLSTHYTWKNTKNS
jgi:glycosyltransferase involved in cell wall biosynthesis